jgi:hypothetical protein
VHTTAQRRRAARVPIASWVNGYAATDLVDENRTINVRLQRDLCLHGGGRRDRRADHTFFPAMRPEMVIFRSGTAQRSRLLTA